jgi:hypothetical protein
MTTSTTASRASIFSSIGFAYGAALVGAVAPALVDFEVLGATLLLSLFTLPSIIGYVISAKVAPARPWPRHLWVAVPTLIVNLYCIYLMVAPTADAVVHDIGRVILKGYLLQIAPAYVALLLFTPSSNPKTASPAR